MRDALKGKWKELYIGLFREEEIVYKTDEQGNIVYMDIDGEQVPVELGKKPSGYEIVDKPIKTNLAQSGGEAQSIEYGIDTSQYSARFTTTNKNLGISETSLLWEFKPTVDEFGRAKGVTADWKVVKVIESKNIIAYLLDKQVK